ncbi:MAG TPA: glycosyl transferase [Flavobacterium sp.]|nr:glycosyl transferase [Flavobacterium sp.]
MISILLFCVLLIYILYIGSFIFGFHKIKTTHYLNKPKTRFSVVVPFRNEASQLPKLLSSLRLLDYPSNLFEVIFVDDDSSDNWKIETTEHNFKVIKNNRTSFAPKKDAINTAITISKHDWIITTDADCIVPLNWLKSIDAYIQKESKRMVVAGVSYLPENGFLFAYQNLDFLSLQGATIGSFGIHKPFMCNGANFAYQKDFFIELNGFDGNLNWASGDDVFLLQKAIKHNLKAVGFCKDSLSVVKTIAQPSWETLFFQRVRWASKSSAYNDLFSKSVAIIIFATNFLLVVGFVLGFFGFMPWLQLFTFLGIKFGIDMILIRQTSLFYKQNIKYVVWSSLLYPFFSSAVAIYTLFGTYKWKDRRF